MSTNTIRTKFTVAIAIYTQFLGEGQYCEGRILLEKIDDSVIL